MKLLVYGAVWASGGIDPQAILKRFVAATPVTVPPQNERQATHYEVEITPEEMAAMIQAQEFDILVSANGYLAFDGKGRGFRQR